MPRYQYRQLKITIFDKHENPGKRRGGERPDRFCEVDDSAREQPVMFLDQRGDDLSAFITRTSQSCLAYLNTLGNEGWQVISYTPRIHGVASVDWAFAVEGHSFTRTYPPCGLYLLMRQVEA